MVQESAKQNTFLQKFTERKWKDRFFIMAMLAVSIVHFCIFYIYLNLDAILLAFQIDSPDGGVIWTFENFRTLFRDMSLSSGRFLISLRNTMLFFVSSLGITLPCSIFMSIFIYKKIKAYKLFRVVFYLPVILPQTVLVVFFKYFIAGNGPLNALILACGGEMVSFTASYEWAMPTLLFYNVFFGTGGNMILLGGALNQLQPEILEAGRIDGTRISSEIFHIILPGIAPTLSTMILFDFIGIFGASGPVLLFTQGAWNTSTISYWIYDLVYFNNSYNYPAAIGLFFTVVGLPIVLLVRRLTRAKED